jgi:hypothetical protein
MRIHIATMLLFVLFLPVSSRSQQTSALGANTVFDFLANSIRHESSTNLLFGMFGIDDNFTHMWGMMKTSADTFERQTASGTLVVIRSRNLDDTGRPGRINGVEVFWRFDTQVTLPEQVLSSLIAKSKEPVTIEHGDAFTVWLNSSTTYGEYIVVGPNGRLYRSGVTTNVPKITVN